jgi:hypothetical protein
MIEKKNRVLCVVNACHYAINMAAAVLTLKNEVSTVDLMALLSRSLPAVCRFLVMTVMLLLPKRSECVFIEYVV